MLLIEGSDCLGKTIVAKKIVRKIAGMGLPVVYGWMTRPNEQLFDFFKDYKKVLNPYAVQDRFHLSGLAYHQDKISSEKLKIINSWIRAEGGIIVLFFASDENWYRERLEKDTRGNILPVDALCEANSFYKRYAEEGDYDYGFDILPKNVKPEQYVLDCGIDTLIGSWLNRRELLEI